MSIGDSCFSLIEDGEIQVISFWNDARDLQMIFKYLRDNRIVHEVHLKHVRVNDQLLSPLMQAIRSNPTIEKICFDNSNIENFVAIFALLTNVEITVPALEFRHCFIYSEAAESLNLLLASGIFQELSFDRCVFDDRCILAAGLRKNESLRSFTYYGAHGEDLSWMNSLTRMISRNYHLQSLCLDLRTVRFNRYAILRSILTGQSLKRLQIRGRDIEMETVQRITQMVLRVKTLKELDFTNCRFHDDALLFLLQALTKHPVITSLNLSDIETASLGCCWTDPTVVSKVSNLQVRRLILSGLPSNYPQLTFAILSNESVQDLDVRDFPCELLLCQKLSVLSELIVDRTSKPVPITSPHYNPSRSCLKSFTWRATENLNMVEFIPLVGSLRRVTIRRCEDFATAAFTTALAKSLKQNQRLRTLSIHGLAPATKAAVRKHGADIRCALALNRVGHFRLMECDERVAVGLWATVLARSTKDPDGIYFVLREIPNIVVNQP